MAVHDYPWEGMAVQCAWLCKAMASGGSDCHTGESSAREEVGEVGAILYPVRTSWKKRKRNSLKKIPVKFTTRRDKMPIRSVRSRKKEEILLLLKK